MSDYEQGWEHVGNAPTGVGGRSKVRTADKVRGEGPTHAVRHGESVSVCNRQVVFTMVGSTWPPLGERCDECVRVIDERETPPDP